MEGGFGGKSLGCLNMFEAFQATQASKQVTLNLYMSWVQQVVRILEEKLELVGGQQDISLV